LLRKNFKVAQLSVERDSTAVKQSLKDTAHACLNNSSTPDEVLKNLDSMIARMRGLKRKLAACAEEEKRLQSHSQARVRHLGALYSMQSLDDVKYEAWSRTRLDRLLVDYMLRNGYVQSATALAQEKQIEELVDTGTFMQMGKIRDSLRNGRVNEVLAWCTENKKELRRMGVSTKKHDITSTYTNRLQSKLEFMVRFQQYIELVRTRDQAKLQDAIVHAKKYLLPSKDLYPSEVKQAAGLLAFPPEAGLAIYTVCIPITFLPSFTNPQHRICMRHTVGRILLSYSWKLTTPSSLSQPSHCSTLRFQQACQHSKPLLATHHTCLHQRHHHLRLLSQVPSVQYAARS
jgi:macrophage erythroblast attacher